MADALGIIGPQNACAPLQAASCTYRAAFGTIVLHVTPEAAAGGPLALVRNGDRIRLSVKERRLDLLVEAKELARRRAELPAPAVRAKRGYAKLYQEHVLQADGGCDFDFLLGEAIKN